MNMNYFLMSIIFSFLHECFIVLRVYIFHLFGYISSYYFPHFDAILNVIFFISHSDSSLVVYNNGIFS